MPLKEWGISIYRGILTGYNDAFIISTDKKNELIEADPKSAEIIRPILRGRDIKRYKYDFADLWLITTHNGVKEKGVLPINIDDYPAIKHHLDCFWENIRDRADQGDTPYNLRNCVYMDDFSMQKIVWARLSRISKKDFDDFPRFALIPGGYYVLDSLCFFVGENLDYLIRILNSKYAAYYFFCNVAILDNGGMQMRQQYIENIPVPKNIDTDNITDEAIYAAFGFTQEEITYIGTFLSNKKKEIEQ